MALPPLRSIVVGVVLLGASSGLMAAPPASSHANTTGGLQAQVKDSGAKIAAARARNQALQAQVAQMEQQTAARAKKLQQRDTEIAALQQKLQAAGGPTSAASSGR